MSRDLTPEELFCLSEYVRNEKKGDVFELFANATFTYANGKNVPFLSEFLKELRNEYPNCVDYIFHKNEDTLLLWQKNDMLFHFFMYELENCIDKLKKESFNNKYSPNNFVFDSDILKKWWTGSLSESFYYSDANDELLFQYLKDLFNNLQNTCDEINHRADSENLKKANWLSFFSAYMKYLSNEFEYDGTIFELIDGFDPNVDISIAYTTAYSEISNNEYEWNVYYSFIKEKLYVSLDDIEIVEMTEYGVDLNTFINELDEITFDGLVNYFGCCSLAEAYEVAYGFYLKNDYIDEQLQENLAEILCITQAEEETV